MSHTYEQANFLAEEILSVRKRAKRLAKELLLQEDVQSKINLYNITYARIQEVEWASEALPDCKYLTIRARDLSEELADYLYEKDTAYDALEDFLQENE